MACFACLDAWAKWANRTTDPLPTASVRYLGSFLLVSLFLNPWSRAGTLRTTRLVAGRDSSETTLFYTGLVGSLVFLPVMSLVWSWPEAPLTWLLLGALGAFGALGHWTLIGGAIVMASGLYLVLRERR